MMDTSSFSISQKGCLAANLAFWTASLLNFVADELAQQSQLPIAKRLRQSKLQPVFLTRHELRDVFLLAALNMILVAPFLCCPLFELLWNWCHPTRLAETDDWHWQRELIRLPIDMFLNEASFYIAHWIMHASPFIYQHVHKVHHRFQAPCAMAAAYAHPLEFIFGNVAAIGLGPIVTNAHPHTAYTYFALAILSTCKGHSGYDILNARTHDDHHRYTKFNFGVLHLGDYIMGTTYTPPHHDKSNNKQP